MSEILKISDDGKTLIKVLDKTAERITIPEGVEVIGEDAFASCEALQSINVAEGNKHYASIDGVLYSKDLTIIKKVPEGAGLKSFSIPNSVTTIGELAFYNCQSLENIDIPASVTTIGEGAFAWCTSLQCIDIPDSVTTIGESAFAGCSSLQSINVEDENQHYASVDGVLYSKDLTIIKKVPEGVGLKSFSISDNVTTIGEWAFSRCKALKRVDIPNSVTTIGYMAFSNCSALQSIHMSRTTLDGFDIGENAFYNIDIDECTLYVPAGTKKAYSKHPVFGEFKKIVEE